jgi:hypothetical protein
LGEEMMEDLLRSRAALGDFDTARRKVIRLDGAPADAAARPARR